MAISWIMIRCILSVAACIAAVFFVARAIVRFFKRHKGILVLTVLLAGALLFFFREPVSAFASSVWSTAEPIVEDVLVLVITIALTLVCTAFVLYLLFGAFIPVCYVRTRRGHGYASGAAAGAAFMYDDYINNGKSEYEETCERMNTNSSARMNISNSVNRISGISRKPDGNRNSSSNTTIGTIIICMIIIRKTIDQSFSSRIERKTEEHRIHSLDWRKT